VDASNRYPGNVPHLAPEGFHNVADHYLGVLRNRGGDASLVTDKMPGNFKHIGLIRLILPNARIVHCRRSPMDTCLSIYKNLFAADSHYYAYDLEELGGYYRLYEGLMDPWRAVLPADAIHEVRYEDMVADQESETRKLLAFCGLEWDDACLAFHEQKRAVNTASATQVRKPVYRDSVELWRRYETQLEPMLEILHKHGYA